MISEKIKLHKRTLVATLLTLFLFAMSAVAMAPTAVAASNTYTPTTLSVGGSTLIAPMMADWQTAFNSYTGGAVSVNYQAVGSTSGTNNMLSDVFSLGYSDAPIPANGLATVNSQGDVVTPTNSPPVTGLAGADPIVQVVDGLAPVSIFYNIPGFRGTLNLTGDIICEIFLQNIKAWNAPQILAINKGLSSAQIADLAKYPITVVHRSDGSGTSFALTTYFGRVDGNWTADGYKAGSTSPTNFPSSEFSAKGTGGVAGLVSSTNGAIGYGETAYAIGSGLVYAAVQNSAGNFILPLPAGATAAAAADASILATNPTYTIVDAPGAASYPISTYTYVFAWANQDLGTSGGSAWTQGLAYDAVQFLYWTVTQGQSYAASLEYAPLPAAVIQNDMALIASINYNGASFIPSTSSTVTCKSTSIVVGSKAVSCTAALTGGSAPTGSFIWSSTAAGTFTKTSCPIPKSGKCTVSFTTQSTSPSETIQALYSGDLNNAPSVAATSLTVAQATSTTTLACSPSKLSGTGQTATCKITIKGYAPTGTVTVSQTGGSGAISGSATCILAPLGSSKTTSSCSTTITSSTAGSVTLTASYPGDANNVRSTKTATLTIK